jgi:toxin ParE1/3/4
MNVIYSPRAGRDLAEIAAYYRASAGERTAATFGQRIQSVIAHVAEHPPQRPVLAGRHNVRSAPILRYPYKVF